MRRLGLVGVIDRDDLQPASGRIDGGFQGTPVVCGKRSADADGARVALINDHPGFHERQQAIDMSIGDIDDGSAPDRPAAKSPWWPPERFTQFAFRCALADSRIAIGIQNDGFRRDKGAFDRRCVCRRLPGKDSIDRTGAPAKFSTRLAQVGRCRAYSAVLPAPGVEAPGGPGPRAVAARQEVGPLSRIQGSSMGRG